MNKTQGGISTVLCGVQRAKPQKGVNSVGKGFMKLFNDLRRLRSLVIA